MGKIHKQNNGFENGLTAGALSGIMVTGVVDFLIQSPLGLIALPIVTMIGMVSGLKWDDRKNKQSPEEENLNKELGEGFAAERHKKFAYAELKGEHGVNRFIVNTETGHSRLKAGHFEHITYTARKRRGRGYSNVTRTRDALTWDGSASYNEMNPVQKKVIDRMLTALDLMQQPLDSLVNVEAPLRRYLDSEICLPTADELLSGQPIRQLPRSAEAVRMVEPA